MDVPYKLYKGDCLEIMPQLEAGSVDAIITDLPYGTTQCSWDSIIPLNMMWQEFKRTLKPNGVFVTTSVQPFTSVLICSNLAWFKYEWIWDKKSPSDPMNVKTRPMRQHENIVVFGNGSITYNPQFRKEVSVPFGKVGKRNTTVYGKSGDEYKSGVGYPLSILQYARPNNLSGGGFHPTQKPIELYEYLIRTYTNPSETVLDICMGSGTTIIAAMKTGRKSIGIERNPKYFAIAEKRIKQAAQQPALLHEAQQSVQRTAGTVRQNSLFITDGDLPSKVSGTTRRR